MELKIIALVVHKDALQTVLVVVIHLVVLIVELDVLDIVIVVVEIVILAVEQDVKDVLETVKQDAKAGLDQQQTQDVTDIVVETVILHVI